jgi:hypothetical protein
MRMKCYKKILTILLILIFTTIPAFAEQYNENGDFTIEVQTLKKTVINEEINEIFNITIKNNLEYNQDFELKINEKTGWTIILKDKNLELEPSEEKTIQLQFKTNSNFDYGTSVRSPDLIKISQKDNYIGTFEFPLMIIGENQNVSLKFTLDIEKSELDEIYNAQFSTEKISPKTPLSFGVNAENLEEEQQVSIILEIAGEQYTYQDTFDPQNNYKIYSQQIPSSIDPGTYYTKITIRLEKSDSDVAWEWKEEKNIEIIPYEKLIEKESTDKTFLKDTYTINITNKGNIDQTYTKEINMNFIKRLLLSSNTNYQTQNGSILFETNLQKGESKLIKYSNNYLPLYIIIIVIIVLIVYIYIRKSSNPLDIETKIYEIEKVKHEGVKSMKIRIGFENIKEHEIENLRLIFRMPSYLNVKNNSFLLREPNHVLKGKNQYKLIWDFKRFEQNDSRIIGFSLVNKRGILGDIKIPDLEIEIKSKGKIKKYYKSFPTIKG